MSAVDELRKILEECGVTWDNDEYSLEWYSDNGEIKLIAKAKSDPGPYQVASIIDLRGTCRNEEDSEGSFLCSECGAHMYRPHLDRSYTDQEGRRWYTTDMRGVGFRYCPSCGRKIENKEEA